MKYLQGEHENMDLTIDRVEIDVVECFGGDNSSTSIAFNNAILVR